jgi:hypothetical protein
MAAAIFGKACLLTALALLAATALPSAAGCPADNADDALPPSPSSEPCEVVTVGLQEPYVDPHPECIDP